MPWDSTPALRGLQTSGHSSPQGSGASSPVGTTLLLPTPGDPWNPPRGFSVKPQEFSENSQGATSESLSSERGRLPARAILIWESHWGHSQPVQWAVISAAPALPQAPRPAPAPQGCSIAGPACSRPHGQWAPPRCRTTWAGRVGISCHRHARVASPVPIPRPRLHT